MKGIFFLTGHVTFKLRYNQIYQLKTTNVRTPQIFHFLIIFQPITAQVNPEQSWWQTVLPSMIVLRLNMIGFSGSDFFMNTMAHIFFLIFPAGTS